jgi:hydroxymethylpyrimidine pyrophosphatase-like HAD family hydrolase
MLSVAGHSFAMSNGNAEVHRIAKRVCGAHDKDGIVEVVEYIREYNARC